MFHKVCFMNFFLKTLFLLENGELISMEENDNCMHAVHDFCCFVVTICP